MSELVAGSTFEKSLAFNMRWLAGGTALLAGVLGLTAMLSDRPGPALVRATIWLALAWYFLALAAMLRLHGGQWNAAGMPGRVARWCWSWGALAYLLHVALAFHVYYQWSHRVAFETTRSQAGVGEGIYFNYLFTLAWTADVAWWWCWPNSYAGRWAAIDWALHAAMLFIVVNGAIVYAGGPVRWASAFGVMLVIILALCRRLGRVPLNGQAA